MESPANTPSRFDGGTEHDQQRGRSLYRLLADERRRTVLAVLRDRSTPIDEGRLAERVVEREDAPSQDVGRVRAALHHTHLPSLEDAGIVDRTADDGVEPTEHEFWDESTFADLLASENDASAGETTKTLDVLASGDRRTMLDALREHGELSTGALAAAASDVGGFDASERSLRHEHLPRLVDAGVVAVDDSEDRIQYLGNDLLEEWWFADATSAQ